MFSFFNIIYIWLSCFGLSPERIITTILMFFICHCVQIDYFHFVIYYTLIHCARVERLFNGESETERIRYKDEHCINIVLEVECVWIQLCGFVRFTSNSSTHFHALYAAFLFICICFSFRHILFYPFGNLFIYIY